VSIAIRTGAVMVVIAGVIGLAGCGDDETTASSTATTEETTASGGGSGESVAISETEYALDPADPSVSAGTVTFDVSNDGEITHNLEVEGPNGEVELDQDLAAGDSGTLEVDLSEPGTYEMYCPIGDHRDQGMEGEITVE
jgi:plastocyanin